MNKKYKRLLMHNAALYRAADKVIDNHCSGSGTLDEITSCVSAPVIFMYVSHLLEEAVKRGIKKIYFLARDGYSMAEAAKIICKNKDLDIQTEYLYCSRFSLRMAAYRFMDDSAYDRLFFEAYNMSAHYLLSRADFDYEMRRDVFEDIGYNIDNEDEPLSRSEFHSLCDKLRSSEIFRKLLAEKSDEAYSMLVGYLKQEGLFEQEHIGIADLGWTGSMQYTLKRILESAGCTSAVTGFYFGMLEKPPVSKDNEYYSWLFDGYGSASMKAAFSHNLMECICTAPHGMTTGYKCDNGRYEPVMSRCENQPEIVRRQSELIALFAEYAEDYTCSDKDKKLASVLLKSLMFRPSAEEAGCFDVYSFCDDVSEGYHRGVAEKASVSVLRNNLLGAKILKKASHENQLYWFYGSLAMSEAKLKPLYRTDYFLLQWLRYFIKSHLK